MAAVAGALAIVGVTGCGEPSVQYELKLPPELAAHGDLFKACLQRCDVSRRGAGCKGAQASLELGGNPCDFACALKVSEAVDVGCPKASTALWQCEAGQVWKCSSASSDAIPELVQAGACAKSAAELKTCEDNGGESVGGQPALSIATACKSRCAAGDKACDAPDPSCASDCATTESAGLADACTPHAAKLIKCQSKSVGCIGGKPFFPPCTAETTALTDCKQANKVPPPAQAACFAACAAAGKEPACTSWSVGACKELCKPYEGFSSVCDGPLAAAWACLGDAKNLNCAGTDVTEKCAAKLAAVQACMDKCSSPGCTCAPGDLTCAGKTVVKCVPSGTGTQAVMNCANYGTTCVDGACVGVKSCSKLYAYACDGDKVTYCDGNGLLVVQKDCAADGQQKCLSGSCVEACAPNATFCSKKIHPNGAIHKCAADGLGSSVIQSCGSASQADCMVEGCETGETACSKKAKADGAYCNDGDVCTTGDTCTAGKCVATSAKNCTDTIACTKNACDDDAGGCTVWLDFTQCNDGNACTADLCDKFGGCANSASTLGCSSGTAGGDACWTVKAKFLAFSAAETHEFCTEQYYSMPASVHSAADTATVVAALKQQFVSTNCLIGLVKKPGGNWAWSDGSPLDYSNWSGGAEPAGPGFVAVDPKTGAWSVIAATESVESVLCKRPMAPTTCSDGDSCTTGEKCVSGKCQGGMAICDDQNACTLDLCTAATATECTNKPIAAGATCDDGQNCTVGDACDGAGACKSATAKPCNDGNTCTVDSCAEPGGCSNVSPPFPIACGDGLACLQGVCKAAGVCGDGLVNAGGEQCDDKNKQGGDGCAPDCTLEPAASCAALLDKFPALKDGNYVIDPDGGGPLKAVSLYCAMETGGWTLVANLYDSAADDVPNLPGDVTAGWQQTGSGQWGPVLEIANSATDTGAAALGLDALLAFSQGGATKLKICLVAKSGAETECRSSPDSLTLGGTAEPTSPLAIWQGKPLVYTYGRLVGLPASGPGFAAADLMPGAGCVVASPGATNEFGKTCTNTLKGGLCEAGGTTGMSGVWCGHCDGICLRPDATADDELSTGGGSKPVVANPSDKSWGVRIYVRP